MATKVMEDVAMCALVASYLYTDEIVKASWSNRGCDASMKTFTDGAMGDWHRYLMYEFDIEREEEIAEEASYWMSVMHPSPSQDSD